MYAAKDQATGRFVLMGLNFSPTADKPMQISIANLGVIDGIRMHKLANLSGETSLFDTNDPPASSPPRVDWTEQEITGLNPSAFQMFRGEVSETTITWTCPDAEKPVARQAVPA